MENMKKPLEAKKATSEDLLSSLNNCLSSTPVPGPSGAPKRIIKKISYIDPEKIKLLGIEQEVDAAVKKLNAKRQTKEILKDSKNSKILDYFKKSTSKTSEKPSKPETVVSDDQLTPRKSRKPTPEEIKLLLSKKIKENQLSRENSDDNNPPKLIRSINKALDKLTKSEESQRHLFKSEMKELNVKKNMIRVPKPCSNHKKQDGDECVLVSLNPPEKLILKKIGEKWNSDLEKQNEKNSVVDLEDEQNSSDSFYGFSEKEIEDGQKSISELPTLFDFMGISEKDIKKIPSFTNLKNYLYSRWGLNPNSEENCDCDDTESAIPVLKVGKTFPPSRKKLQNAVIENETSKNTSQTSEQLTEDADVPMTKTDSEPSTVQEENSRTVVIKVLNRDQNSGQIEIELIDPMIKPDKINEVVAEDIEVGTRTTSVLSVNEGTTCKLDETIVDHDDSMSFNLEDVDIPSEQLAESNISVVAIETANNKLYIPSPRKPGPSTATIAVRRSPKDVRDVMRKLSFSDKQIESSKETAIQSKDNKDETASLEHKASDESNQNLSIEGITSSDEFDNISHQGPSKIPPEKDQDPSIEKDSIDAVDFLLSVANQCTKNDFAENESILSDTESVDFDGFDLLFEDSSSKAPPKTENTSIPIIIENRKLSESEKNDLSCLSSSASSECVERFEQPYILEDDLPTEGDEVILVVDCVDNNDEDYCSFADNCEEIVENDTKTLPVNEDNQSKSKRKSSVDIVDLTMEKETKNLEEVLDTEMIPVEEVKSQNVSSKDEVKEDEPSSSCLEDRNKNVVEQSELIKNTPVEKDSKNKPLRKSFKPVPKLRSVLKSKKKTDTEVNTCDSKNNLAKENEISKVKNDAGASCKSVVNDRELDCPKITSDSVDSKKNCEDDRSTTETDSEKVYFKKKILHDSQMKAKSGSSNFESRITELVISKDDQTRTSSIDSSSSISGKTSVIVVDENIIENAAKIDKQVSPKKQATFKEIREERKSEETCLEKSSTNDKCEKKKFEIFPGRRRKTNSISECRVLTKIEYNKKTPLRAHSRISSLPQAFQIDVEYSKSLNTRPKSHSISEDISIVKSDQKLLQIEQIDSFRQRSLEYRELRDARTEKDDRCEFVITDKSEQHEQQKQEKSSEGDSNSSKCPEEKRNPRKRVLSKFENEQNDETKVKMSKKAKLENKCAENSKIENDGESSPVKTSKICILESIQKKDRLISEGSTEQSINQNALRSAIEEVHVTSVIPKKRRTAQNTKRLDDSITSPTFNVEELKEDQIFSVTTAGERIIDSPKKRARKSKIKTVEDVELQATPPATTIDSPKVTTRSGRKIKVSEKKLILGTTPKRKYNKKNILQEDREEDKFESDEKVSKLDQTPSIKNESEDEQKSEVDSRQQTAGTECLDEPTRKKTIGGQRRRSAKVETKTTEEEKEDKPDESFRKSRKRKYDIDIEYNSKLLTISSREDLYKEKEDQPLVPLKSTDVRCGLCKDAVPKVEWNKHAKSHYYIAWKEGETPINVNDYRTCINVLTGIMKKKKITSIECRLCDMSLKSSIGLLNHLEFCKISDEERKKLLFSCPYCEKRISSKLNLKGHLQTCKGLNPPSEVQTVVNNADSHILPRKRKAGLMAEKMMKEKLKEIEDCEMETNDLVMPYVRRKGLIWAKWKNEIRNSNLAKCIGTDCNFESSEFSDLAAHYNKCTKICKTGFCCKSCKFVHADKSVVQKHVAKLHIGKDFEQSDDDEAKFDSESSDSEGSSHVGEREWEEEKTKKKKKQKIRYEKFVPKIESKSVILGSEKWQRIFNCHRQSNFRAEGEEWTRDFQNLNYSTTPLFTHTPSEPILKTQSELKEYLPKDMNAISLSQDKMRVFNKQFGDSSAPKKWEKLSPFESKFMFDEMLTLVGGPITALAWIPRYDDENAKSATQYLAVAYKNDLNKYTNQENPEKQKVCILIFEIGTYKTVKSNAPPQLLYGIPIDSGPIVDLQFLPSGGYAPKLNRLGLMAVATQETDIHIYSLPLRAPESCDSKNFFQLLELKPTIVLSLDVTEKRCENNLLYTQCKTLAWSKFKGHTMIAGGFINGYVAIWDISDDDNLNCFPKDGIRYFVPTICIQVTNKRLANIDLHYDEQGPRWMMLITCSRETKIVDLCHPTPFFTIASVLSATSMESAKWPLYWENPMLPQNDETHTGITGISSYSPFGILYRTRKGVKLASGTTDIDFNAWQNSGIGGCWNGDVVVFRCYEWTHDVSSSSCYDDKHLSFTDLICLDGKPIDMTVDKTEEDYKLKYGFVISSFKQCRNCEESLSPKREASYWISKYVSVNKVASNPNRTGHKFYAVGYLNGLVRIFAFDS